MRKIGKRGKSDYQSWKLSQDKRKRGKKGDERKEMIRRRNEKERK